MKKLLALIAASLALCACDTVNTVERANPSANKKMVDDIRIVTDSAVDDYAYVAGINEAKTQGGLLKIQAEIKQEFCLKLNDYSPAVNDSRLQKKKTKASGTLDEDKSAEEKVDLNNAN